MTQETTSYDEQETTSYDEQETASYDEKETSSDSADDTTTEDEPYFATFAMVRDADSIVQDVLVCLNTFKMSSYYFVQVADGVTCTAGMYYDSTTGTFEDVSADSEIPSS